MSLAALQQEFMGQLLDEERPAPTAWNSRMQLGLDIYRNAYRTRLVDALEGTFERTAQWVGEDSFHAAAAHYLISEPPAGWTLDRIGVRFAATLEALFANDPEVADLAWLEWAMHCAFTAADAEPLTLVGFAEATANFEEQDWPAMTLGFVPGFQLRAVGTDCAALWRSLKEGTEPHFDTFKQEQPACVVWREELSPVFRLFGPTEGQCLLAMSEGARFGDICAYLVEDSDEQTAAVAAGDMLANWIHLGLVASVAKS